MAFVDAFVLIYSIEMDLFSILGHGLEICKRTRLINSLQVSKFNFSEVF